jgi:hypothetical protein
MSTSRILSYRKVSLAIVLCSIVFAVLGFPVLVYAQIQSGAEPGDAGILSTFTGTASALLAKEIAAVGRVPIAAPGVLEMQQASTIAQLTLLSYHENVSRPFKAALRDVIVKRITDIMTDMIIQWAQGGFQNEPLFVTDWKAFLNEAADVAFDSVNNDLMSNWGVNLCGPFAPQLQVQLIGLQRQYSNQYAQSAITRCTIQGFEQNLQNTANYLQNGNWLAFEAAASPDNNYFGVSLQVKDQYLSRMAQEAQSRQSEAQSSGGFLSQKTCIKHANPSDPNSSCMQWETQTPGDTVAKSIGEAFTVGKYDFTSNIQSIVAAIVNGVISILTNYIQQGLAGATSNYSQTTNYGQLLISKIPPTNPPSDGSGGTTGTSTETILQNYADFESYYSPVVNVYGQALTILTQTASSCPSLVSGDILSGIQTRVTTITQALSDAQTNISQASTASSSEVVAAWQTFSTTYAELWTQVLADALVGTNSILSAANAALQSAKALQQQCLSL